MNNKKKIGTGILAVMILTVIILLPHVLQNDYYMVVVNRILINTIVVLGLNFITGLTGQMNLGTAGIYALGAYSSALFVNYTNLSGTSGSCSHGAAHWSGSWLSQPSYSWSISFSDNNWICRSSASAFDKSG